MTLMMLNIPTYCAMLLLSSDSCSSHKKIVTSIDSAATDPELITDLQGSLIGMNSALHSNVLSNLSCN